MEAVRMHEEHKAFPASRHVLLHLNTLFHAGGLLLFVLNL